MPSRRCLTEEIPFVWEHPDLDWLERVKKDEFLRYEVDSQGRTTIWRSYYSANRNSDACPFGYGDEDVIKECFANP